MSAGGRRLALCLACFFERQSQFDKASNCFSAVGHPILLVVTLVAATIVAVPSVREPVLRAAGWALVINEPITPADIIVVSSFAGGTGALEAADLVQSGIAMRVAVASGPPSGEDHEFIRRGLP